MQVQIITTKLQLRRVMQQLELNNVEDNTTVSIVMGGSDPIINYHTNNQMGVDEDSAFESICDDQQPKKIY